jgi:hypothetical protein
MSWRQSLGGVFALALVVVGCASTHMRQYLGKDIREVVLDSGPPINIFDMPDSTRAFQFRWGGGTYIVPQTTTTTGAVMAVGNSAWFQNQSITTGGGVVTSEGCVITYLTTWDPQRQAWIGSRYRIPKQLVC